MPGRYSRKAAGLDGAASPCNQICHIPEGLDFCIGCGRTRIDIQYWLAMTDALRVQINEQAAARQRRYQAQSEDSED